MDKFVIKGGRRLCGEVVISGAKNSAVAILPAVILSDEPCVINNVPAISDVNISLRILREMGADITPLSRTSYRIDATHINRCCVPYETARKMRASYYFLGALLGKFNQARVSMPGGCPLGDRPIDQHLKAFSALGADYTISQGMIDLKCQKLKGGNIFFDVVTVGATMNAILAAVRAEGLTVIENAAKEPHIVDLANFLNSMGANIMGAGTDVIKIRGVKYLKGTTYTVIPDQIEAGTFMIAAAATNGNVLIKNVIPKHLESITKKLEKIGVTVEQGDDSVRVYVDGPLVKASIKTTPHPGFPTDMQPQITVALGLSKGTSIVTESIFENRFKYVDELTRMGANIKVEGNTAIIDGVSRYTGANISAPDLRAGAALVLAAMSAEGFSTVDDIRYIERGYEDFHLKLQGLGAQIELIETERDLRKFKLKIG